MIRPKRNRRRLDVAKKTGEIKAVAKHHALVLLKICALLVSSVGIAFGGLEGWQWAITTRQFALKDVSISGEVEATEAELVRLSGMQRGQNLVAMDVAAMERAIATHPWVKTVKVSRHLPSRLSIEVTEHRAIAMLSLGELYLLNAEATPFKRIRPGDAVDLPLVTGLDRDGFAQRRQEVLTSLNQALELIVAYGADAGATQHPLSEVKIHADGVTAVTSGGQEIEFGEGDVAPKLKRLARVREELHARSMEAEVIRLDNRTRPAWVAVQIAAKKL